MTRRNAFNWFLPLAAVVTLAIAVTHQWTQRSNAASNVTPTASPEAAVDPLSSITALPTQLEMEEFPPYWVTIPADSLLPNEIKIEITAGVITGVATTPGTPDYHLIGTRYMPGSLDATDVTRALWRTIDLNLSKPDGSIASVQIGRPIWWIEDVRAKAGSTVNLAVHEVGIEGDASILSITAFDADTREGAANSDIVIGKIKHQNAVVLDLVFNNANDEPLGVTANHPLFSSDRDDWVPAGDLRINERVQTIDGVATLTSKSERAGRHGVYNMEVHRSHAYHVSQFGILAHNTGISCRGLEHVSDGVWRSKQGLTYGFDPKFGNRVKHVLAHTVADTSKAKHSVFSIARRDVIKTVDEAFTLKVGPGKLSGKNRVWDVDMGHTIGTAGETRLRLILRDGTMDVITAFHVL